jgi:hypothetical protein
LDAFGRVVELTGIDLTLALWRPVNSSSESGCVVNNVNQWQPDA